MIFVVSFIEINDEVASFDMHSGTSNISKPYIIIFEAGVPKQINSANVDPSRKEI